MPTNFAKLFAGRMHYAWVVLAVMIAATIAGVGVRSAPGVMIIPLQHAFGWDVSTISGAISGVMPAHATDAASIDVSFPQDRKAQILVPEHLGGATPANGGALICDMTRCMKRRGFIKRKKSPSLSFDASRCRHIRHGRGEEASSRASYTVGLTAGQGLLLRF